MTNSPKCIYCEKELNPEIFITTESGPACDDCALRPEESRPTPNHNHEEQPAPDNFHTLETGLKELLWVRQKQMEAGEVDAVILKRSLLEIIVLMEQELANAKEACVALHNEAALIARFHAVCAISYGLAFLSTHPSG